MYVIHVICSKQARKSKENTKTHTVPWWLEGEGVKTKDERRQKTKYISPVGDRVIKQRYLRIIILLWDSLYKAYIHSPFIGVKASYGMGLKSAQALCCPMPIAHAP